MIMLGLPFCSSGLGGMSRRRLEHPAGSSFRQGGDCVCGVWGSEVG